MAGRRSEAAARSPGPAPARTPALGLEDRADAARRGVIRERELFVIDNPPEAHLLMAKLKAALPLPALATPPMLAQLQEQAPALDLSPRCQITQIHYAGDEGGILCKLDWLLSSFRVVGSGLGCGSKGGLA